MRVSRYHVTFLVLVLVVGCAAAAAVYYVERVYRSREEYVDKVREGRTEELHPRPPARPEDPAALARTTSRAIEALVVVSAGRASDSGPASRPPGKRLLVIRANGELTRLPASADEAGPLVTGVLDRAQLDGLLRTVLALPASVTPPPGLTAWVELEPGRRQERPLVADGPEARAILGAGGRQMNRTAAPERPFVRTAPADAGPAAAWPLQRSTPEALATGGAILPESDRARFRRALLELLAPGARFSYQGAVWRVVEIDLLPP